ncbi:MAG: hypothetical protein QXQ10_00205 [Nitrososphaerota archaeon]
MESTPLIDALVIGGSLSALIASVLAIYMVVLALRVYRLTLTAYTNIRDTLMQVAIQVEEKGEERAPRPEEAPKAEQMPQPERQEVRAKPEPYTTLSSLVSGEGFEAALIFDESGQVIDQQGVIDGSREAALLTEVINSLQLARSSVKSFQIRDGGGLELLIPSAEIAGRKTFLYVKASRERTDIDFELLSESARRILRNLLGGG